jgi:putative ABC transport system permease protein
LVIIDLYHRVAAQQQIISSLRQRHNIRPGRDDDFTVRTQQEITEAATVTSRVMIVLLGAIAGVSLLVGGIGIMNIMLVSVTERAREIGVCMAVGARGHDILTQFLIEAVTLSSVGGVIRIICGIAASRVLSIYVNRPTLISISSIAVAFLFSASVSSSASTQRAKPPRSTPSKRCATSEQNLLTTDYTDKTDYFCFCSSVPSA